MQSSTLWKSITSLIVTLVLSLLSVNVAAVANPTFEYETTVPGYYLASARGIAVDAGGNSYAIARTIGDYQQNNILIVKLDSDGDILWEKYIDRYDHDYATGIVHNGAGQVYVTGWTDSPDFPITAGALDTSHTHREVILMKLSAADGSILYSTFLGGDHTDEGYDIAVNDEGEIILVGYTKSTDFPTVNAYQNEPNAPLYVYQDVFITKLNPAGDSIIFSTYFGGYKNDVAAAVELDQDGNIVIAGNTNANDFPLVNPIMSDTAGLFISKLSADGSSLMFSTYFGGLDVGHLNDMTIDPDDYIYITGSTRSVDFPTTAGAYQEEFVGEIDGCSVPFGGDYNCPDIFVSKLSTEGEGLIFSTYLGGSTTEDARGIAIDNNRRVYVVGYSYSDDFPGTDTGFVSGIILSRFDATGSNLDYTISLFSGSSNAGHGIAVDDAGDVYFGGAINVPADVYLAKIVNDDGANLAPSAPSTPSGIADGDAGTMYEFATSTTDPNGDLVYYCYDWGDGDDSSWVGPYNSGEEMAAAHSWETGIYDVRVKAKDTDDVESDWSNYATVTISGGNCGDLDGNGSVNISDVVYLTDFVFADGPAPDPLNAGDVDCSGATNVSDVVYLINFVLGDGYAPCDSDGDGVPNC
jgi:hypothetical protein